MAAIASAALHDDLAIQSLRAGNPLRVRARGGSMLPFLRDGDVLLVRPVGGIGVRIGDVLCYEPPSGGLCLHRVVARGERGFVTRGDALPYLEDVPEATVLGVVTARERRGRTVALDTPAARCRARLIVLGAAALARCLPLVRTLWRLRRGLHRG